MSSVTIFWVKTEASSTVESGVISCHISLAASLEASVATIREAVLVAVPTDISPISPSEWEAETLDEGERLVDGDSEVLGDNEVLGESEADSEVDGLRLVEGDSDVEGESDKLADAEGLTEVEGDRLVDGEVDIETLALGDELVEGETLALGA